MHKPILLFIILLFACTTVLKAQVGIASTGGSSLNGNYPNLKTAFDAINNGIHKGSITIKINASVTETATARLNQSGGTASYSDILILPTVDCVIGGSVNGPMIDLNGADKVTIDGRIAGIQTYKSLTIQNTYSAISSDVATIRLINGASNNNLKFLNILGSAQGLRAGNITFAGTNTGEGNSNNIIESNEITAAGSNFPGSCIRAWSTSAVVNSSNTVRDNLIHEFYSDKPVAVSEPSCGIYIDGANTKYQIIGNSFYQNEVMTGNMSYPTSFIKIAGGEGHNISGNYMGGNEPHNGGYPTKYIGKFSVTGISLTVGSNLATTIDNNTIDNLYLVHNTTTRLSGYQFTGINSGGGNINVGLIKANIIGNPLRDKTIIVNLLNDVDGGGIAGIVCKSNPADNYTLDIRNNRIGSFMLMGDRAKNTAVTGISIDGFASANIQSNYIGNQSQISYLFDSWLRNTTFSGRVDGVLLYHAHQNAKYNCEKNAIFRLVNSTTGNSDATVTGITVAADAGYNNQSYANNITYNTLDSLKSENTTAQDGSVRAIYMMPNPAGVSNTFLHNSITYNRPNNMVSLSGAGTTVVAGIVIKSPFNTPLSVRSNIVYRVISSAYDPVDPLYPAVQGITVLNDGMQPVELTDNIIQILYSLAPAPTNVIGLYSINNNKNTKFTITRSNIFELYNAKTTDGTVMGMLLSGTANAGSFDLMNNMISLRPDTAKAYGIVNNITASNLNLYFNTVGLSGSAVEANGSAAFYRPASVNTPTTLINNIFYNARSGGTSTHLSFINENSNPATGWTSSYNDLFVSNEAINLKWGNQVMSLSDYQAASGQDQCSMYQIVDFLDLLRDDLYLAQPSKNNEILYGMAIPGITKDYNDNPRLQVPAIGAHEIALNQPKVTASSPTTSLCPGQSILLESSHYSGINQWYFNDNIIPGETGQSYKATKVGSYKVIYTENCQSAISNVITLTDALSPVFTFTDTSPVNACEGADFTLRVKDQAGLYQYRWYKDGVFTGITAIAFPVIASGVYKVEVSACPGIWVPSKEVTVNIIKLAIPVVTADAVQLCAGEKAALTLNLQPDPAYKITWMVDGVAIAGTDNKPSITALESGNYSVLVSSTLSECNKTSAAVNLYFNPACPIFVPNTFTPNNDGVNDTWVIPELQTNSSYQVFIYNRFGQLMFSSIGYGTPWDGKTKGHKVNSGTYYYIITNPKTKRKLSGSVSVIY